MQNKILKIILNVSWLTSTNLIHEETEIQKTHEYMKELTLKYNQRNLYLT